MNSTQSQTTNSPKPTLHGVKIKQRKGVQKAQAKHEPESDLDDISAILDKTGNTLEYRKYGESLFEILLTGGILQPGGIVLDDVERSPFSIFGSEDDAKAIKKHVDVFNKLIRHYKYLQRPFEETLKNILQFINKWPSDENSNLAKATGYFITTQLANPVAFKVLLKDHLVKDGHSLGFATAVFRTILSEQSIDQLGKYLVLSGMDTRLLEFFPPNKREEECLIRHFEAEDMKALVGFHQRNQKNSMKGDLLSNMKNLLENETPLTEVLGYLKEAKKEAGLDESDLIPIIWMAIVDSVDLMNTRPDQVEAHVVRALNHWSKLLEAYTTSPKNEILLLQRIQLTCYENAKITKVFSQIAQLLYKNDVLSDNAILYWADKAHKPQGKTVLLKQMAPFVQWLHDNEDSSEEED
ncbi:armadillo-type protein [Absidia repens]|uniref:Armadillo-type protein n=1 Tax=Absidia repens TaxID=90262 RepID=A0A1X2IXL5_9FUNG|nr:armadillo-type protein [Absidia repens]